MTETITAKQADYIAILRNKRTERDCGRDADVKAAAEYRERAMTDRGMVCARIFDANHYATWLATLTGDYATDITSHRYLAGGYVQYLTRIDRRTKDALGPEWTGYLDRLQWALTAETMTKAEASEVIDLLK